MCTSSSAREKVKRAGLDLGQHAVEAGVDLLGVVLGDDALRRQHRGMRLGGADVLGRQSLVEADGGVYLLHDLGGRHGEAATPHLVGVLSVTRWPYPSLLKAARRRTPMLAHDQQPGPGRSGLSTAVWAAALAAVVGFVSVYVTLGRPDNAGRPAAQAPPPGRASPAGGACGSRQQRAEPGADGRLRVPQGSPSRCPRSSSRTPPGKERTLADWRGKVVLLNLWATWCLPCRKEMPALDRLQARDGLGPVRGGGGERRPHRAAGRQEIPRRDQGRAASPSTPTRPRAWRPRCGRSACRRRCSSTPRAARSAACSAPPNGTARTPSA